MKPIEIKEPEDNPVKEREIAIGIDLGTTNSLVAFARDGRVEVFRDEDRKALLPSVVAYNEGEFIVGTNAGENPVKSIKRLMGRGVADIEQTTLPFETDTTQGSIVRVKIGDKTLTPVEISAEILKVLKTRAEKALNTTVTKAVITVPAYFDDAARTATKDAARLAGLEVLRLVNEPTAAALAYGLDNQAEGIYAVYDLGGGTFDISLLKMEKGVFQVLAAGGDTALGGDDIDHAIAEYFLQKYAPKTKLSPAELGKLQTTTRGIKEYLSENNKVSWNISIGNKEIETELNVNSLNELVAPTIDKTIDICRSALEDAKVMVEDVKGVVLVGGSTRLPLVYKKIQQLFGQKPLANVNPDEVVAMGAAIQADMLTGGGNYLLLDVNPLSLGIETMGGIVEVIIPRNSPIPATHSQKFTTYKDGQTGLKIHILQGEREMVDQCRSLAEFELGNIPPMPAGAAVIEVVFTIDADGILTVSAREETTGTEQKITVKPSYGLPPAEIERMLRESMENAKADIGRRLLAESRIKAEQVISAIESAIKEDSDLLSDKEKTTINQQITLINNLLAQDDNSIRDELDYEVQQLEKTCSPFIEKRMNRNLGEALGGKDIAEI